MVGDWVTISLIVGLRVDGFDVNSISEKNPTVYFLEGNLKYLYELYKLHNYYPLAPEKYVVRFLLKNCRQVLK